jgi:hypothetical protein
MKLYLSMLLPLLVLASIRSEKLTDPKSDKKSLSEAVKPSAIDTMLTMLSPDESKTISIIMQTLLPSMFGLFSNITSEDYKANFKEPCRFDSLLDIFKQLPAYFDIISAKYPDKPDLAAYYSMQLASTFLVNNGSLTMSCLYNMLSLQTRLMKFSLNIMDNPEKNPELVGLFGIFMKPVMGMLKKNSMMKIIDHVDRYDKNDDLNTVNIFNMLNFFYCLIGLLGILCNVLLVILLKRSSTRHTKKKTLSVQANGVALINTNRKSNLKHGSNIYETRARNSGSVQQNLQLQPLSVQSTSLGTVPGLNTGKRTFLVLNFLSR